MFVKWKKRKISKGQDILLIAVLVQSNQADGKSRHQSEKYLGSIRESYLNHNVSVLSSISREIFWKSIDVKLDGIALDPWSKAKIVASLAKMVRKPSEDELEVLRSWRELFP